MKQMIDFRGWKIIVCAALLVIFQGDYHVFAGRNASFLRGTIRDERGVPVQNATVVVGNWHAEARSAARKTVSGKQGEYLVTGLSPGRQSIEIQSEGHEIYSVIRDLKPGFQGLEITIKRLGHRVSSDLSPDRISVAPAHDEQFHADHRTERGIKSATRYQIRGQVIDAESRRGISNARLLVHDRATMADRAGRFTITGIPGGKVVIMARADEYQASTSTAIIDSDRTMIIPMNKHVARVRLAGKVLDNTGNPIRDAEIHCNNTRNTATSDKTGEFLLEDLRPGITEILATAPGFKGYSQNLEMIPGTQNHRIVLKRDIKYASLTGRILHADGTAASAVNIRISGHQVRTDSKGYYHFPEITPGEKVISVMQGNRQLHSRELTLFSGGQTCDLILP